MNHSRPPRKTRRSSRLDKPVDDRYTDPVQPARNLVRVLVELSAGVEVRHGHFGGADPLLVMNADGNAAAVIGDGDRAVGLEGR